MGSFLTFSYGAHLYKQHLLYKIICKKKRETKRNENQALKKPAKNSYMTRKPFKEKNCEGICCHSGFPVKARMFTVIPSCNRNFFTPQSDHVFHHLFKGAPKDYKFLSTLGAGSFGRVMLATTKGKDDKVNYWAIKILNKEMLIKMKQVKM